MFGNYLRVVLFFMFFISAAYAGPVGGSPSALVAEMYEKTIKTANDKDSFDIYVERDSYVSKSLIKLWLHSNALFEDEPEALDFDPVTVSQDPSVLKSFKIQSENVSGNKSVVVVVLEYITKHRLSDRTVKYHLIREANAWRVDDIQGAMGGAPWSMRKIFRDSLK